MSHSPKGKLLSSKVAAAHKKAIARARESEKALRSKRGSARNPAQKIEADFRPFTFHALRHLCAVEWLKSGGGIYELSQHLGHTSVKTTEIYLAFLTADEKAIVMKGSAQNPAHEQRFSQEAEAATD